MKFGAENETRTRDPNLGKVVLYQLSYFRKMLTCLKLFVDRGVPYCFDVANVRRKIEFPNFVFTFFNPHMASTGKHVRCKEVDGVTFFYKDSASAIHMALLASLGILQSPRGERVTDPTFGPSGRADRLNC